MGGFMMMTWAPAGSAARGSTGLGAGGGAAGAPRKFCPGR